MNASAAAIDFDAAEEFLRQARAAAREGNADLCLAARQMVVVALDLGLPTNRNSHSQVSTARAGD